MKRLAVTLLILVMSGVAGCGGGVKRATLPTGVSGEVAVLSLGADTTGLTDDQETLLQQTLTWMDRDLLNALKAKGLTPTRINQEKEFKSASNGHLLKVTVTDHKTIPKGARFMGGMMAGADRLNVHYDLLDHKGKTVLAWDDVQASTKSGTHCAKTLNRNAAEKVASYLSGK